mmetsp:Transcript_12731/g.25953  ORF Transcript_12731/g.25953 Transcript_12731/m.25953 type:complete len:228 (+) Transcript_12731:414-1097(+)
MVAVFLEDLRCGNTRLSNSPSSLPSTPLIHRRCCHATANPSLTPSSRFDYLLWSLLYTPLEKALPSPRVATALMCLWAPEETIRSMISPLPRTSRIRPLSGSYTSRTTDCSRSYCSLDMGTMDLDLDVFAAAAARCCCCCCCFCCCCLFPESSSLVAAVASAFALASRPDDSEWYCYRDEGICVVASRFRIPCTMPARPLCLVSCRRRCLHYCRCCCCSQSHRHSRH